MTARLLAALLELLPHSSGTARVRARFDAIAAVAEQASSEHGVPVGLLLAVGWHESWLGTHPRSGGLWGGRVPPVTSRILARGRRGCGSWLGAVSFFRCGRCACPRLVGYEPGEAIALASRVYARAAVDSPL